MTQGFHPLAKVAYAEARVGGIAAGGSPPPALRDGSGARANSLAKGGSWRHGSWPNKQTKGSDPSARTGIRI